MTTKRPPAMRLTVMALQLLTIFLADPLGEWHGYALHRELGINIGAVASCLHRLERWGWLSQRWEDKFADNNTSPGPARLYFRLTELGIREAGALLALVQTGPMAARMDIRTAIEAACQEHDWQLTEAQTTQLAAQIVARLYGP